MIKIEQRDPAPSQLQGLDKAPDLKTEDVILCCLIRAITLWEARME